jgi:hypothetical protein
MDRASRESAVKTEAPQQICPTQNRQLRRNPSSQLGDKIAVHIGGYVSVQEDAARLAIGTMMKARAG